jgi:hypothetical protein
MQSEFFVLICLMLFCASVNLIFKRSLCVIIPSYNASWSLEDCILEEDVLSLVSNVCGF